MLTDTLEQLLNQLIEFTPRFVGAILLLVIGIIIAKIVAGIIKKLLVTIRVDKFGEKLNEIELVSKANMEIKISTIFSKIIYYFLFVFFLVAASDILAMPAISDLVVGLFNLIPKLIVAIILLIFGTLLSELIRSIVDTTLASLGIASHKIISMVLFYFLFINIVILAIAQAEINTEFLEQNISIIIGGGVLAFAIGYGLASKDIVANFLSALYTKDKVSIGDVIEIDGEKGQVVNLDKTSITIATEARKVVYPLKSLLNEKVIIYSDNKLLDT